MRCRTGTHPLRGTNGSRFCEAALHAASRPGHEEGACADLSVTSLPATNAKRLRKKANGSREGAPDDRLRDDRVRRSSTSEGGSNPFLSLRGGMDCFACARNDGLASCIPGCLKFESVAVNRLVMTGALRRARGVGAVNAGG
jgi:hypothetical protein